MNFYDYLNSEVEVADITEDMEKIFKSVIREAIKKCTTVGDWGGGEFRDILMYKGCNELPKTIGCIDGDYFLLSCNFFYDCLAVKWEKWMHSHKDAPYLPDKFDFFKALFYKSILPHGVFFQDYRYKFIVDDDGEKKPHWYFFISPEYFGYKDSMIEWH